MTSALTTLSLRATDLSKQEALRERWTEPEALHPIFDSVPSPTDLRMCLIILNPTAKQEMRTEKKMKHEITNCEHYHFKKKGVLVSLLSSAYVLSFLICTPQRVTNYSHNMEHEGSYEEVEFFQYPKGQKWIYRSPLFLAPNDS